MRPIDERRTWADSGASWLTGWSDGPVVGPPRGFLDKLVKFRTSIAERSAGLGHRLDVDPLELLTARAGLRGFRRNGRTSCGGVTHLMDVADGLLAVSLARPDDVELVAAWLGVADVDPTPEWIAAHVADRPLVPLLRAGAELGLAVGGIPEPATTPVTRAPLLTRLGDAAPVDSLDGIVVVDLGALWAAPLCAHLLGRAGATVVKVESTGRPDGARQDPSGFFDLVNSRKRSVAVDLADPAGVATLAAVVERADVVVESSRPRALRQLGIDAARVVADGRPKVWMSITGHGRSPSVEHRVGFGDDAAVAGGLVGWADDEPCFLLDAVADPLTAVVATDVILDLLRRDGAWLADVSLAATAARFANVTRVEDEFEPTPPPRPHIDGPGPALGAHTAEVLDELGIAR